MPASAHAPAASQPVVPSVVPFDMAEMSALADGISAPPAPAKEKPAPTPKASAQKAAESDDEEEQFSLKTRSMAEVLAEQGDYVGALDIYEELLKEAKTDNEKISLEDAIARLSADVSSVTPAAAGAPEKIAGPEKKGQDKGRLLDVLELLADRLESKAE